MSFEINVASIWSYFFIFYNKFLSIYVIKEQHFFAVQLQKLLMD